jgi:hypothetical protein
VGECSPHRAERPGVSGIKGLAVLSMKAKFDGVDEKFKGLEQRVNDKFTAVNQRFDDMRDLWRAELRRVEVVLDARLKHMEEK